MRVQMLPTLITLGNGICGFASIIVASRVQTQTLMPTDPQYHESIRLLAIAGSLIFVGMIFDVFDGLVARMTRAASKFGAELDSLCDVISFGAAPAFMALKLGPSPDQTFLYRVLFVAATSYVVCTILRLARFNVETGLDEESHRYFKGLPSPAAAGCIASIAIARWWIGNDLDAAFLNQAAKVICNILPFAVIGLALLMVSTIRYRHLVNQKLRGRKTYSHLVKILALVIVAFIIGWVSLLIVFWIFALMGPVSHLWQNFSGDPPNNTNLELPGPPNGSQVEPSAS